MGISSFAGGVGLHGRKEGGFLKFEMNLGRRKSCPIFSISDFVTNGSVTEILLVLIIHKLPITYASISSSVT